MNLIVEREKSIQALEDRIAALRARDADRYERSKSRLLESKYAELRARSVRPSNALGARQYGAPSEAADRERLHRALDQFDELHGDRHFRDDPALVGGFAKIRGRRVMVLAQQKGRDTKENIRRNFGIVSPGGLP